MGTSTTVKTKFELKMGVATREAYGQALAELGKTNPNVMMQMTSFVTQIHFCLRVISANFMPEDCSMGLSNGVVIVTP